MVEQWNIIEIFFVGWLNGRGCLNRRQRFRGTSSSSRGEMKGFDAEQLHPPHKNLETINMQSQQIS
jgi:hypothetical protein